MTTTEADPDVLEPDDPDAPLDHDESRAPWVVPDEEDTSLVNPSREAGVLEYAALRETTGSHPNVPFSREIRQGMHGKDVLTEKRGLSRARPDLYPWTEFTQLAGEFFLDAVVKYKRAHNFGRARVLGSITHESLERQHRKGHPDEWAFDAVAIKLAHDYWDETHISPEDRIRTAIVQSGFFWYDKRLVIAYSQYRPFQLGKPPYVPSRWDCSAFVTNCHYAGGAPNPNGRPWDHLGYTGTLMSRGVRVGSVHDLKPGDMIFYGSSRGSPAFPAGSPTHVSLYVGVVNGTPMTLSMGSYPMAYVEYNYRHDINHYRHYQVV